MDDASAPAPEGSSDVFRISMGEVGRPNSVTILSTRQAATLLGISWMTAARRRWVAGHDCGLCRHRRSAWL